MDTEKSAKLFAGLVDIVKQLRGPDGCPWDKEQDQRSLVQYAIEEAFELADAIESKNQAAIKDELGDFLFQVVLQAQVAADNQEFDLCEVIENLNEKMIRRHPHVFTDNKEASISKIWDNWEKIKKQESKDQPKKVFSYPKNLPALIAANKIGVKSERYRFDWQNWQQVWLKVEEEIGELMFVLGQLARHLKIDPEQALRDCNRRFENRFLKMLEVSGLELDDFVKLSESEKEKLYHQAKKLVD